MKIDWFTVIAQGINFIILLWLMKRFLYQPILQAIDAREKRIAEELADAETAKSDAKKQKEEYEYKNDELERKRAALLDNAQVAGETEKNRLLKEAQDEADVLREKHREALVEEEAASRQTIRRRTQELVITITRKVLADLAGASFNDQVAKVFNQRLHTLNEEERKTLILAQKSGTGAVEIRTAFNLTPDQKRSTEATVKEITGSNTTLIFETAPELIGGIELSVNGRKLAWSVGDYLSSIQENLDHGLDPDGNTKTLDHEKKSL